MPEWKRPTIPVEGRVSYKSLVSERVYYGTVKAINGDWARIQDSQGMRMISVYRLKFIPNVFAGGKS